MILVQGDSIVRKRQSLLLGNQREVECYASELSTQPGVLMATHYRILLSSENVNLSERILSAQQLKTNDVKFVDQRRSGSLFDLL